MQDICGVPSCPANVPEVSRGRRLPYLMSTPPAIGRMAHRVRFAPAARRSSGMAHPCPRGCISRRNSAILAYRATALRHLASPSTSYGCRARTGFPPAVWSHQSVGMAPDHAATGRLQHGRYNSASTKAAPEKSSYHPCRCCAQGRFSAPSLPDRRTRRHAAEDNFGRFRPPAGSDGALRLTPPARRTPPRRASSSRRRGSPRCRAGGGPPPAGRSGRSRRPSAAPASRCRDRPPAPPPSSRGPPGRRQRRQRPARRRAMRGRDADEPAPHVLHTNDIDAARSVAAAGRPPSLEPIAMSAGRASRADGEEEAGRKRSGGWRPGGRRRRSPTDGHHGANDMDPQTIERAIKRCIDISVRPRRPRGRSPPRGRPRHRPVRGRDRRNAAMARRPRVKSPAAGPEATSAAEPHPSSRCVHKHAGGGSRRSEGTTTTAPSAAP